MSKSRSVPFRAPRVGPPLHSPRPPDLPPRAPLAVTWVVDLTTTRRAPGRLHIYRASPLAFRLITLLAAPVSSSSHSLYRQATAGSSACQQQRSRFGATSIPQFPSTPPNPAVFLLQPLVSCFVRVLAATRDAS